MNPFKSNHIGIETQALYAVFQTIGDFKSNHIGIETLLPYSATLQYIPTLNRTI